MPDPITWYALGKEVSDPTSIDEEIDAKILLHNQDASAHGQSSESLYNHRISELLDHVAYSIYNIKTNPAARIFKAIVSQGPEGDFTTLQAAIDWCNLYGGGVIFIKAGTYTLTSDITLYSNIKIEGEDEDTAILDFATGEYQLKAIGTSGTHKKNIEIRDVTIKRSGKYDGGALALTYCDDCVIENNLFTANKNVYDESTRDIDLTHCQRITIKGNRFESGSMCFAGSSSKYIWIKDNYVTSYTGDDFNFVSCDHVYFTGNLIKDCDNDDTTDAVVYSYTAINDSVFSNNVLIDVQQDAFRFEAGARITISNNVIVGRAGGVFGIYAGDVNRIIITGNSIKSMGNSGIYLSNADRVVISGNGITDNGGFGVEISNAACNDTLVVSNCLYNNTLGTTLDNGTGSLIDHNVS